MTEELENATDAKEQAETASPAKETVEPVAAGATSEVESAPAGEPAEGEEAAEEAPVNLDEAIAAAVAGAEDEDEDADVLPLELVEDEPEVDESLETCWYILKVQVNRESTVCDALQRRVKVAGLEPYFERILVPTEEVREFTKAGKQRIVKRKLYPGYIMVKMAINDDSWFLVRETPGIGDFTGSAGRPTPMDPKEIQAILRKVEPDADEEDREIKTTIKHKPGDRVRVKEGYFENFEGEVETVDEASGRISVIINIFNRSTPVELEHWQVEEL